MRTIISFQNRFETSPNLERTLLPPVENSQPHTRDNEDDAHDNKDHDIIAHTCKTISRQ